MSMKLDLDGLFALFEELNAGDLLTEQLSVNAETVLKLLIPKIEITGKSIGNQEVLNRFIEGVPGTSIGEKLNQLSIMTTKSGKVDKRGKNLSLLTEKIAILDALTRMFTEFEASPAGFLNETFISAFFPGGTKIDAQTANSQNLITDVRADKEYSIKTISKNSVVGGSAYNLCNTVHNYGSVTYLVFEKGFSGKGESKTATSFTMYEYVVTKDNLSSISLKGGGNAAEYYAKYKDTFEGNKTSEKQLKEQEPIAPEEATQTNPDSPQPETRQEKVKIEKRDFIISPNLYKGAGVDPVTVNFSTAQALEDLSEAIGDAIEKIKLLHQEMQTLAAAMSKYFTSQREEEKQQLAQQMLGASEKVEPKTKEVVKEE